MFINLVCIVYPVYPYRKDVPRGFLQNAVIESQRELTSDRVEKLNASLPVDEELHEAVKVILMTIVV